MVQRREDACLTIEPRESRRVRSEARRQDLDRDIAPQRDVAGAEYLAHAAGAERRHNLVVDIGLCRSGERLDRRPFRKRTGFMMSGEQRHDLAVQRTVFSTGLLEKRGALMRRALDRGLKELMIRLQLASPVTDSVPFLLP
jgi:hypothetical protein